MIKIQSDQNPTDQNSRWSKSDDKIQIYQYTGDQNPRERTDKILFIGLMMKKLSCMY